MFWIILACLGVILAVAYMIYSLPEESHKKKKRREQGRLAAEAPVSPEKNWEEIARRWEKHNQALLADLEKVKVEERKIIQDLQAKQAENKDLLERLALEKSWREKEQVNLDKAKTHERDFKEQIVRTEKDLEVEHSGRLRTERDLQELKIKYEAQMEEKRVTLTQAKSLEATLKQMTNDLAELRRNNEELKKKREDIQWVAKSAYDELLAKYNQSKPSPP